jgi:hypothetical protein
MVFDIKMDFSWKARFVAGASMTYSSVVSRESVRLAFLIASLNDIDIMSRDLENAYLNAKCREKIWFEGGLECAEDKGKVLIIVRALYGLKSAGASWRAALAKVLAGLGFESTKANPDVSIRKAVRPDGFQYYEMLFVFVDDILALSHEARKVIGDITQFYRAKEGSIKPPDIYLGSNIDRIQLSDGREVWCTSPQDYVKNAISVIEHLFEEDGKGYSLKNEVKNPFPSNYWPEIDVTNELASTPATRFMQLIGILRWAIKLGRINIFYEVSALSQYQANPRMGHLEVAYHIFAYLKKHPDMG